MALSNLLLLLLRLQRNGLGIEDPHYLSMILIVERTWMRQLFQPLAHFIPACFIGIAMFTIRMVDSQE
jgi:hypothetical protein